MHTYIILLILSSIPLFASEPVDIFKQGRRQGVSLGGGGGQKCFATAAASLESRASPEKADERGGGGGPFFSSSKMSSWTWLTAELTSN